MQKQKNQETSDISATPNLPPKSVKYQQVKHEPAKSKTIKPEAHKNDAQNKQILGTKGEEKAWLFLKKKGFVLLEKNWRSHPHEIDLICLHKDTLVFVEVKSRKTPDNQSSLAAFHTKKQNNIVSGARKYLTQKNLWHKPCRFDLICIFQEHTNIEHFENVIIQDERFAHTHKNNTSFTRVNGKNREQDGNKRYTTHSRDTSWQPW